MKLLTLILTGALIVCCAGKDSIQSTTPNIPSANHQSSAKLPVALDNYSIPVSAVAPVLQGKCDTVLQSRFGMTTWAIANHDSVPLWTDPLKKEAVGYMNFADTATMVAYYVNSCNTERYSKLYSTRLCRFVYTLKKNVSGVGTTYSSSGRYFWAAAYYQAAEENFYSDTLAQKRFISLLADKCAEDTIRYEEPESGITHAFSGYAAARFLQLRREDLKGDPARVYRFALKILQEGRIPDDMEREVIYTAISRISERLKHTQLSKHELETCFSFLKSIVTDHENNPIYGFEYNAWLDLHAANTIVARWHALEKVVPKDEALNTLLHSGNKAVVTRGLQLQSAFAIAAHDLEEARNIVVSGWRRYRHVTRVFYKDDMNFSLVTAAATIDSLVQQWGDYQQNLSFLHQLGQSFTAKDTLMLELLEDKKLQLCLESDCPGMDYTPLKEHGYSAMGLGSLEHFSEIAKDISEQHRIKDLMRNDVVIARGTLVRNGVHGKKTRQLKQDLKGKVLYRYGAGFTSEDKVAVKVESNNEVFWVNLRDARISSDQPLFTPSANRDGVIDNPRVASILPYHATYRYLFRDINGDGIADMIGQKGIEYAIDGRTMETLWDQKHKLNELNYITFAEDEMYIPSRNGISRHSLNNEIQWNISRKIPDAYGSITNPVIPYKDKVYVFTSYGYLLALDRGSGTWDKAYKFGSNIVRDEPVLDGSKLYFICRDEKAGRSMLYMLDLDTEIVYPQFEVAIDKYHYGRCSIQVHGDTLYFNTEKKIVTLNTDNGKLLQIYDNVDYIEAFKVAGGKLFVSTSARITAYNPGKVTPIWERHIQFNPEVLVRDGMLYACTRRTLMLLKVQDGATVKELPLPIDVHSGQLTYYNKRLLIPAGKYTLIIENQ